VLIDAVVSGKDNKRADMGTLNTRLPRDDTTPPDRRLPGRVKLRFHVSRICEVIALSVARQTTVSWQDERRYSKPTVSVDSQK
jgi:hypothetical protein